MRDVFFRAVQTRPATADGSRSSSASSPRPSCLKKAYKKKSSDPSKLFIRPCSPDVSSNLSRKGESAARSTSPKRRPRLPRAFSTNSSPKGSRESSPRCGTSASEGASPKSSPRAGSPTSSTSSIFRRWGWPYPPNSKNSTRPCSPDYTVVHFEDEGGVFPEQKRQIKTKSPRGRPSVEHALKFAGGKSPASKRLMQVMMCAAAAAARVPLTEAKVHKLVFYKNTDKENLIEELESLKAAVADQLHKTHLHALQTKQKLSIFSDILGMDITCISRM